ncbi:MAG: hypothetical protein AAGA56_22610 [Myxococcota bacterium]
MQLRFFLGTVGALVSLGACAVGPPQQAPPAELQVLRTRPPDRPGASIDRVTTCACRVCEPRDCCHEHDEDAPEIDADCAEGYDFSGCELAVASCGGRCRRHTWRTDREVGCSESRPSECCYPTALIE